MSKSNGMSHTKSSEHILMTAPEFARYVGIGRNRAYEILHDPRCTFAMYDGQRVYANKIRLDERLAHFSTLV